MDFSDCKNRESSLILINLFCYIFSENGFFCTKYLYMLSTRVIGYTVDGIEKMYSNFALGNIYGIIKTIISNQ